MKLRIRIRTVINPTEDEEKVRKAIENIFPDAELKREGRYLRGETDSPDVFREKLRAQRILDAARGMMVKGRKNGRTVIYLNKQAAYAGKINFTDENAILSPLVVEIESDDLDLAIDYLAPPTEDGRPVKEVVP